MVTLWGIPRTLGRIVRRAASTRLVLLLWRLALLLVVLVGLLYLLSMGPLGGIVAGAIAATFLSSTIRSIVLDFWNLRFVRIG